MVLLQLFLALLSAFTNWEVDCRPSLPYFAKSLYLSTFVSIALMPCTFQICCWQCVHQFFIAENPHDYVRGAPPIVASGSRSMVYLWDWMYMIGTPGICTQNPRNETSTNMRSTTEHHMWYSSKRGQLPTWLTLATFSFCYKIIKFIKCKVMLAKLFVLILMVACQLNCHGTITFRMRRLKSLSQVATI